MRSSTSTNEVEFDCIRHAFLIQHVRPEMHAHDLSEHQLTCSPMVTERFELDDLALKLHRRFPHARRLHLFRGDGRQPRFDKFIHAFGIVGAGQRTGMHQGVVHQVHNHLSNLLNVVPSVFGRGISAAAGGRKNDQRRVCRENVEVAEWGQIHLSLRIDRADERNGTRSNAPQQACVQHSGIQCLWSVRDVLAHPEVTWRRGIRRPKWSQRPWP